MRSVAGELDRIVRCSHFGIFWMNVDLWIWGLLALNLRGINIL